MSISSKTVHLICCDSCHDEVVVRLAPCHVGTIEIQNSACTILVRVTASEIICESNEMRKVVNFKDSKTSGVVQRFPGDNEMLDSYLRGK